MLKCKFCGRTDGQIIEVPLVTGAGREFMHRDCGEQNVDSREFKMLLEQGRPWISAMSSARYTRRRNEKMKICYEK